MSLSDCENCWATPCECGYSYKYWAADRIERQIDMLVQVLKTMDPERAKKYEEVINGKT